MLGRRDLKWRDDGDGLVLRHGRSVLLHVVPDARWPGMWRIRRHDGRLSDMLNISRAKDAARSIALAELNRQETLVAAPPVRFGDGVAVQHLP